MTIDVAADELIRTRNCEVEGCTAEGKRHPNVEAALCDRHLKEEMRRRGAENGLVAQTKQLEVLARRLERARAKAEPVVRELQIAQREWNLAVAALSQKD